MEKNFIRLETRDRRVIAIDLKVLQRSMVIQNMLKYCDLDEGNELKLAMHGINSEELLKILLWLEFHKDDEEPQWVQSKIEPEDVEYQIDDWDKEFLREKLPVVRSIMQGADYLEIRWLLKLCARKLRIRGSSELYLHVMGTISPLD
ncbi:S-phase kinase-associated protein 1 [Drosophila sulfurigaster albostrigata]|uniref:S-phase kinase-associated protein 1 n=1 Tax=Drosophila sulfurigaster albostrigata TaxID=89887 RepID=UPI002D21E929|nr:S-phase kinase-associated protein 1 [Drosophila sulfurigaster albostrigata]